MPYQAVYLAFGDFKKMNKGSSTCPRDMCCLVEENHVNVGKMLLGLCCILTNIQQGWRGESVLSSM